MWAAYIEKHRQNSSGKNNPMYGKPSPQGSGNGWKGWYKGFFFRSLREACFMIRMDEEGKEWKSGESISIPYEFEGKSRTYHPDFIIGNKIIEIKPKRLINSSLILAKTKAAKNFCSQNGYEYEIFEEPVSIQFIGWAMKEKNLKFQGEYWDRYHYHLVSKICKTPNPYKKGMKYPSFTREQIESGELFDI